MSKYLKVIGVTIILTSLIMSLAFVVEACVEEDPVDWEAKYRLLLISHDSLKKRNVELEKEIGDLKAEISLRDGVIRSKEMYIDYIEDRFNRILSCYILADTILDEHDKGFECTEEIEYMIERTRDEQTKDFPYK